MTSYTDTSVLRAEAISLQGASPELAGLLGVLSFPVFLADSNMYAHVSPACPDLDTLEATASQLSLVLPLLEASVSWCSLCTSRSSAKFFMESLHEASSLVRLEALAQTVRNGSSLRLLGVLYEQHRVIEASRRSVASLAKDFVLASSSSAIALGASFVRPELTELASAIRLKKCAHSPLEELLLQLAIDERLAALENSQRLTALARTANVSLDEVVQCASGVSAAVSALMSSSTQVVLCGFRVELPHNPAWAPGSSAALFALDDTCVLAVPEVVAAYAEDTLYGKWLVVPAGSSPPDALASSLAATWGLLQTSVVSDPFEVLAEALDAARALTA